MALVAIRLSDGRRVESFSIDPAEWNRMRSEPLGSYVMQETSSPAILKRSIRGLQFFANMPGAGTASAEPMSEHHMAIQAALVTALRTAGMQAGVEVPGETLSGERWVADVMLVAGERKIAIEVQLAGQTLEEYERRSERYRQSGIAAVWLVRRSGFDTLARAILTRAHRADAGAVKALLESPVPHRPVFSLPHLAVQPLDLGDPKAADAAGMRVRVFPPGQVLPDEIGLSDFALGIAAGALAFLDNEWRWIRT